MMYTWKNLKKITTMPESIFGDPTSIAMNVAKYNKLLKYVDIIVDGEYKEEEKLWNGDAEDGLISSVGSGNQVIWDVKNNIGYAMKDLSSLRISEQNNQLIYELKSANSKRRRLHE